MTKLKNLYGDKNLKLKLWPNLKTQLVREKKISGDSCDISDISYSSDSCDSSESSDSSDQINFVTFFPLKIMTTQKLKCWQHFKTQIVTKLKKTNFDKTQKLKLWQNSKIQILRKLKNTNCGENSKTQIVTKLKG